MAALNAHDEEAMARMSVHVIIMCGYLLQPLRGDTILGWGERAPPGQIDYCEQLAYWNPKEMLPKCRYASALVSTSEP